ncbi:MAG: ATP-dependent DNA helicase [Deltaproteobacteria bacterium]|nr:ATP-dependent DNA helicase [Deltaproteobacteria bacterium]
MNLDRYFAPGEGLLSRCVERWEPRPQQVRMAEVVSRCLEDGGTCAVEAATGTGKTFAYLVPALAHAGRVVVATGTRNLQDQIYWKDLPLLQGVDGLQAPAVLMKGLSNYLCLRRYDRIRRRASEPSLIEDPHMRALIAWASTTRTGDVSELEGVPEGYAARREIVSGVGLRLGGACPFFGDCFVTKLRRRAEKAKLIVTNHHLFFADLVLREVADGVLPEYDAVIFDEAHRLDDVATEFFGHRTSLADVGGVLREGLRVVRGEYARGEAHARSGSGREPVLRAGERSARTFFEALAMRLAPILYERKGRGSVPDAQQPLLRASMQEPFLDEPLTRLYHELDDILERAAFTVAAAPDGGEPAAMASRRILDARDEMATVLEQLLPGYVFWAEVHAGEPHRTRLGASPVDLGPIFRERVFERIGSVVLTSATLSPDRSMGHMARTIGYPAADSESLVLSSPFDIESSSILYVPDDLPEPSDRKAAQGLAGEIRRLVELTGGGALILFSSWRMMKECFEQCAGSLGSLDVFIQGESPKHELLLRLKRSGNGVLFATSSFREGVDVPGPALRLVIVDKIPFEVPDDPIVEARLGRVREAGGDPFNTLQLPAAALSLKQGLGRLLRTSTDRGILAILDPRIWTRRYGRRVLTALPPCPVTRSFSDVERFWQGIEG